MRFKRKIPAFIFGVSIGLLVGFGFFVFKLDDYFKRMRSGNTEKIKIVEQTIQKPQQEPPRVHARREPQAPINTSQSPAINYSEVDHLLQDDENINVAKEELISIKNIKVIDLDNTPKDTLTGQLAGVTSNDYPNMFFVEFWKTPLNSKGYRMTRNRVILYGLEDFSNLTIYKVDDNFYLKSEEQVYKLSAGTEFKPMERVSDTNLLARIN